MTREELAAKYFKGHGLEIGGLPTPWPTGLVECEVEYCEKELRHADKHTRIDDGNYCAGYLPNSFDFICNSHVLEHMEDPIGAIESWLRILKPRGHIVMAIPEMTQTFDKFRPITTWSHIVCDWKVPGHKEAHRAEHYAEYCWTSTEAMDVLNRQERFKMYMETKSDTHFHVWDARTLAQHFLSMRDFLPFVIKEWEMTGIEVFVVLEKTK